MRASVATFDLTAARHISSIIHLMRSLFGGQRHPEARHANDTALACVMPRHLLRSLREGARRVVEDRPEPALHIADIHPLARRVVLHLVALDLADTEIIAFGMRQIEAR